MLPLPDLRAETSMHCPQRAARAGALEDREWARTGRPSRLRPARLGARVLVYLLALTICGCQSMSFPEPESESAAAPHTGGVADTNAPATPVSDRSPERVAQQHPKSWAELSREGREAVRMRDLERAEGRYVAALQVSNAFAPGDVRVRATLGNLVRLAQAYQEDERFEDAQRVLSVIIDSGRAGRPADFDPGAPVLASQASQQQSAGQVDEAIANLEAALGLRGAQSAANAPARLEIELQLGAAYGAAGRPDEAAQMLESVIATLQGWNEADAPVAAEAWLDLARASEAQGDEDSAEAAYLEAIRIQEKNAPLSPELAITMNALAWFYLERGRNAESAELAASAVAVLDAAEIGGAHLAAVLDTQATADARLGRMAEAERSYRRALEARDQASPAQRQQLDDVVRRYASLLRESGRNDEATAVEKRLEAAPAP
jgi:tetratricopeptide (TPR) repeat protein